MFDKLYKIHKLVEEVNVVEDKIKGLEEKKKNLSDQIAHLLDAAMGVATFQDLDSIFSELYWLYEAYATMILRLFKAKVGRKLIIEPSYIDVNCQVCGDEIAVQVTSWSNQKKIEQAANSKCEYWEHIRFICEQCKPIRSEKLAETAESNKKVREQNRAESAERLRQLKTMPYVEYLKTEHWKALRSNMLRRAGFRCQLCNAAEPLDVHHRTYENRGCESYQDLIALCRSCHEKHHDIESPTEDVSVEDIYSEE